MFWIVISHACQQTHSLPDVSAAYKWCMSATVCVYLLVTLGSCRSSMLAAAHYSGSSKLTREQRMWLTFPQTVCMCSQLLMTRRYCGQECLLSQCMCTPVLFAVLQCLCTPVLISMQSAACQVVWRTSASTISSSYCCQQAQG